MIADLKPYPEYKESGLPWLGQVPGHWSLERTKWQFRNHKELNASGAHTNILSLTLRGVVNNDPDDPEGLVPKDYRTYQFFAKGDLVFKLIDLENLRTSRVGLVHEDGIMSSAYVRLTPSRPANIRYFFHQFYDLYSRGIYNQLGAGVRSTLGPSDLLNVGIAVPPPEEQAAIVRFLDWANGRLERTIRAKRKVIALLNEQKQAIIHRAVTRGLDPSVPLKPSGIPWLGDIPQHWEVVAAKQVSTVFIPQRDKPDLNEREGFPWITPVNVGDVFLSRINLFVSRSGLASDGYRVVPSGSVIALCVGRFGVASINEGSVVINQQLQAYIPSDSISAKYFRFCVQVARPYFDMEGNATTLAYVNRQGFGRMPLPLPPRTEQEQIEYFLESEFTVIDQAIAQAHREILLSKEYRTRLVADVVTGKLDVREAAARLPDEAPPDTVKEAADGLDETEPDDDEAAA